MSRCISCDAEITGKYCAVCGEKVLDAADLDWRHYLIRELPQAIFDIDGVLPRTLISLFKRPGELAQAFVTGRRRPFVNPIRLYILAFLAYELTKSFIGHGHSSLNLSERASLIDPTGLLKHLLDLRGAGFWKNLATEARVAERAKWLSESGTFIISIFLAMIQSLIFLRLGRKYLEHLALALNVTTFFLLCLAIGQLLVLIFDQSNSSMADAPLQTVLALIALPIYWFLSARRFYGITRLWAGISAVVMTVGTVLVASALNVIAFAILIVTT